MSNTNVTEACLIPPIFTYEPEDLQLYCTRSWLDAIEAINRVDYCCNSPLSTEQFLCSLGAFIDAKLADNATKQACVAGSQSQISCEPTLPTTKVPAMTMDLTFESTKMTQESRDRLKYIAGIRE